MEFPEPEQSPDSRNETDTAEDEGPVRTLFVSGLPLDIKERELHNLFRFTSGFEWAQVSYTGERRVPVGFIVFADQERALEAMESFKGMQFDPDSAITLRVELAKANSKPKRRRGEGASSSQGEKRMRSSYGHDQLSPQAYSPAFIGGSAAGGAAYGDMHHPHATLFQSYSPYIPPDMSAYSPAAVAAASTMVNQRGQGPPPCSTLFVGNLSAQVSQNELENLFREFPGFERVKVSRRDDSALCFVEFQTVQYSTLSMNQLQGVCLPSSDRGPLRIQYAKNRMGTENRV